MYRLKKGQESLTVMDGPDAGKTYEKDVEYGHVPESEKSRFEKVKFLKPTVTKTNDKKKEGGK